MERTNGFARAPSLVVFPMVQRLPFMLFLIPDYESSS